MVDTANSVGLSRLAAVVSTSASAMSAWVDGVRGGGSLDDALRALHPIVGADLSLIARLSRADGRCRLISAHDCQAGKLFSSGAAFPVVGNLLCQSRQVPKAGSVWSLREAQEAISGDAPVWLDRRIGEMALREVLGVALEAREGVVDVVEFQFRRESKGPGRELLAAIAGELARTWSRRLPGVGEREVTRPRLVGEDEYGIAAGVDILSADNPAELSRSEFRTCMLLREGLKVRDIRERLGVSEATVRSHLSAIYAKTGRAGQVELLHLLLGQRQLSSGRNEPRREGRSGTFG